MKRQKHDRSSLSLFEPAIRWSDLPLEVRQQLVDLWARLLVAASPSTNEHPTSSASSRHGTSRIQENSHDSP
jgi:hypothetical protein